MRQDDWLQVGAETAGADDGAVVVGESHSGLRGLDLTIRSPVLAGLARVRLLLPPGWTRTARRTWPVLWLLAGGEGGHTAWTTHTDIERLTAGSDIIVVLPDGGRYGIYTDWWNSGAGGPPKWETFHLTELRQILERGYRAGTRRAIAGNSLGGMGALSYAARHRGLFRAAASFSGPLNTLHRDPARLDGPDLIRLGVEIGAPGVDWRQVWGDPDEQRVVWRQHNPFDLADRLAGVRLYVSAGDGVRTNGGGDGPQASGGSGNRRDGARASGGGDPVEGFARTVTQQFADKLKRLGVPVSVHLYQGTHTWPYWRRELHAALPLLLAEIT